VLLIRDLPAATFIDTLVGGAEAVAKQLEKPPQGKGAWIDTLPNETLTTSYPACYQRIMSVHGGLMC
jgi:hypothetical protein